MYDVVLVGFLILENSCEHNWDKRDLLHDDKMSSLQGTLLNCLHKSRTASVHTYHLKHTLLKRIIFQTKLVQASGLAEESLLRKICYARLDYDAIDCISEP